MIERDLVLDYDLIRGLPGDVTERVQELLSSCDGWEPRGKPIKMKVDNHEILVQCMVKYDS